MLRIVLPLVLLAACKGGTDDTVADTDTAVDTDTEGCDDADATAWYGDGDGDGYGAGTPTMACAQPAGMVADGGDCDDADAAISPAAVEVCDAADVDEDCDGLADDADPSVDASGGVLSYADADGDGFGDPASAATTCDLGARVLDDQDCDDTSAAAHPGGVEVCDDVDDDCDGTVDWGHRVPSDYADIPTAIGASAPGDVVCVEAGTYPGPIDLAGHDLTLVGTSGSALTTIDGGGKGPVVTVASGETATLRGFTITGGQAADGAGVYAFPTSLTLADVEISRNRCDAQDCRGTGLEVAGGSVVLDRVDVVRNVAAATGSAYGAGAWLGDADVTVTNSAFDDNEATGSDVYGAALYAEGTVGTYTDVSVSGNVGDGDANVWAALYFEATTSDVTRAVVASNIAASGEYVANAGAYTEFGTSAWRNVVVSDNVATGLYVDGSGFYTYGEHLTVANAIVTGNAVSTDHPWGAAGMALWTGVGSVTNATIAGNELSTSADQYGGIGLQAGLGTFAFTNVAVTGNTLSGSGTATTGGVWFDDGVTVRWVDSWGNDVSDWSTDVAGTDGNFSADPEYADTTPSDPLDWDLTPLPGSPLIDAGDPSLLDPDGTTSDVGAWGGPGAADW